MTTTNSYQKATKALVGARNEMPGARAASGGPRPDPELAERPRRRRFSGEYKLRILREAAGSTRSGEIAAMLRREGLYTSHLTAWRKQQDAGALKGLEPRASAGRAGRAPSSWSCGRCAPGWIGLRLSSRRRVG